MNSITKSKIVENSCLEFFYSILQDTILIRAHTKSYIYIHKEVDLVVYFHLEEVNLMVNVFSFTFVFLGKKKLNIDTANIYIFISI